MKNQKPINADLSSQKIDTEKISGGLKKGSEQFVPTDDRKINFSAATKNNLNPKAKMKKNAQAKHFGHNDEKF